MDVASQSCGVCGGALMPNGVCTVCGTRHEVRADGTMVPVGSGAPPRSGSSDPGFSKWLSGESSDGSLQVWLGGSPPSSSPADSNTEALKKWLTGEERAFDEWLGGAGAAAPESAVVPADVGRKIKDIQAKLDDRQRDVRAREIEIDGLHAELGAFKKMMNSELSTFKSGRFDPVKYIEETAMLSKDLQTEIAKRKELEEEIDHIKKGSIAVIKYVKAQQLKSGATPDVKKRLQEESVARRQLEIQLQKTQEIMNGLKGQVEKGLAGKSPEFRELKQKELALAEREAGLKARESELVTLQDPSRRGGETG